MRSETRVNIVTAANTDARMYATRGHGTQATTPWGGNALLQWRLVHRELGNGLRLRIAHRHALHGELSKGVLDAGGCNPSAGILYHEDLGLGQHHFGVQHGVLDAVVRREATHEQLVHVGILQNGIQRR